MPIINIFCDVISLLSITQPIILLNWYVFLNWEKVFLVYVKYSDRFQKEKIFLFDYF